MPATTLSNYPDPSTSFAVAPTTYGGSPGAITVPASTAPTAVPLAMAAQNSVYNQLPQYGASLGNVGANIQSETAGQLPQDVVNQITQTAAERGISTGMPGSGSANASLEQALGLNSLALTETGQKNLEGITPQLAGNTVANSPSLYATPQLYEGASASALGLGNQNLSNNAALVAAQQGQQQATAAGQQQAYLNKTQPGGATIVGGGSGGVAGTGPTTPTGGTTGSGGAAGAGVAGGGSGAVINGAGLAGGGAGVQDTGSDYEIGAFGADSSSGYTPSQGAGLVPTSAAGQQIPAGYVKVDAATWDAYHNPQDPVGYLPAGQAGGGSNDTSE